jgi:hypothetical protein
MGFAFFFCSITSLTSLLVDVSASGLLWALLLPHSSQLAFSRNDVDGNTGNTGEESNFIDPSGL